jgi:hypothetical protein
MRFVYSGPNLDAVLDKLPTAQVIEDRGGGKYVISAEVFGPGAEMWLRSQGDWVEEV